MLPGESGCPLPCRDLFTFGLLVVARTEPARLTLTEAMAERRIEREYQTVVWGRMGSARGVVDAPVGRSHRDPTKRAVVEDGRSARTHYEVETRFSEPEPATLLIWSLLAGLGVSLGWRRRKR